MLTVSALALTACGSGNGRSNSNGASSIVWAVNADASGLDPQNAGQDASKNILQLVYQHLMVLSDGVNVSPQLASSYKRVSPTVYDFTIRSDVKFSNGRTMTTADVVGSFERLLSAKEGSYLASRLQAKSVTAVGSGKVRFTLSSPFAGFLSALSDPAAAILPMKELKAGTFDPTKQLLGTGPYKVDEHQQGSSWTFSKNQHYWESGLPKVSKLKISILPDQGTQIAALRSGAANIATFTSSEAKKLTSALPNVRATTQTQAEFYTLLLNEVASPQLASQQTRQGINLAIDRSEIASVGLGGAGEPAGPAYGLPDSCDVSSLPFSKSNPAKARTLLAAGGASTKPMNLIYDSSQADMAGIAQVVKSQLAKQGITVNLQPLPSGQWAKDTFTDGDFDLSLSFYSSGTDPYFGLVNWSPALSGYTSKFSKSVPAIETPLAHVLTASGQARSEAIAKTCLAIDADSGQIPLVSRNQTVAWNTSKLSVKVQPTQNAQFPLSNIASYTLK